MHSLSSSSILRSLLPPIKKANFPDDHHIHHRTTKLISNTLERIQIKINQATTSSDQEKTTKNNSFGSNLFKSAEDFICKHLDLPLRPSIDPRSLLSGNLYPVSELPPTTCVIVEGSLPTCLNGAYIRNGPNSQFIPQGPCHLFDGDGMLHMIRISNGQATFCSRFVKTYKYLLEKEVGHAIIPSAFSSFNGVYASAARIALAMARIILGVFNPMVNGMGTANTSVAIIGGQLHALAESDLPYRIRVTPDGDIITINRQDFNSTEPFLFMTAHPKLDSETGETFCYRYHVVAPRVVLFRIDSNGNKVPEEVPIFSLTTTPIMHDFALTKHYAIFNDAQMVVSPWEILKGRSPMRVDAAKVSRIGVIPRYAVDEGEMWWTDAPGFNMLHAINAWEEDGGKTVVIVATNLAVVENIFDAIDSSQMTMEEVRISVEERKVVSRQPLSPMVLELPVINPAYAGKKNRYVYAAALSEPKGIIGAVKIDLSLSSDGRLDCVVASRIHGPGFIGSEIFFVSRDPNNPASDEDDGFLLSYVHDENTKKTKFLVMDAKSQTLEIVAAVELPGRVPGGFHGLFVSETQLQQM